MVKSRQPPALSLSLVLRLLRLRVCYVLCQVALDFFLFWIFVVFWYNLLSVFLDPRTLILLNYNQFDFFGTLLA